MQEVKIKASKKFYDNHRNEILQYKKEMYNYKNRYFLLLKNIKIIGLPKRTTNSLLKTAIKTNKILLFDIQNNIFIDIDSIDEEFPNISTGASFKNDRETLNIDELPQDSLQKYLDSFENNDYKLIIYIFNLNFVRKNSIFL